MAVATFGTIGQSQGTGTPRATTHTIAASQSNVALLCAVGWFGTATHTSDVWDLAGVNEALTELIEDDTSSLSRGALSGLANPSNQDGTPYSMTTTFSVTTNALVACLNLSGVDQTTPFSNATSNYEVNTTSPSVSVTTNADADDLVIGVLTDSNGAVAPTAADTELWNTQYSTGDDYHAAAYASGGTNPQVINWTGLDGTDDCLTIGVLINAAAVGGGGGTVQRRGQFIGGGIGNVGRMG